MATHKVNTTRKATHKSNKQGHKKSAKRVHSKKTKKATRKSRQATSKSRRHQKGGVGSGEASRVLASQTASTIDPFGRKVHAVASAISSIF
jgi:hypothetical protein